MQHKFITYTTFILLAIILALCANILKIDAKSLAYIQMQVNQFQKYSPAIDNNDNPIELVNTRHNFGMFVASKDKLVSSFIRINGTWEEEVVDALNLFVKPGDVVLHLGAHIGFDDIILGNIVGPTGKIYSFEPNPESYDIARKNIIINNLDNIVELYKLGATDKASNNTTNKLCFDYANTGAAFVNLAPSNQESCYDIKLVAIDSILHNVTKINFLFMDIEGFEIKAINGAQDLLHRSPNALILTEWSYEYFERAGSNASEFIKSYIDAGYRFFKIVKDVNERQYGAYVEISTKDLMSPGLMNVLMIPKEFIIDEYVKHFFRFR